MGSALDICKVQSARGKAQRAKGIGLKAESANLSKAIADSLQRIG